MRRNSVINPLIAYILIVALLLPIGGNQGLAGENGTLSTIDPQNALTNSDLMKLSVSIDEYGAKRIDDTGIQWTLELNSIASPQPPSRIRLTLSQGQVFSAVVVADPAIVRVTAVSNGGEDVLYDTQNTLSGPQPVLSFSEVAYYEIEVTELDAKAEMKFLTAFDDDSQATFEALAVVKADPDYKAFDSVYLRSREKTDITVDINWLELENEASPQEAKVSLTNLGTKEVFTQTGTDTVVFEKVPKYTIYEDEAQYEISQEPIEGYTTTVKGFSITNIKDPDPIETITELDGTLPSGEAEKDSGETPTDAPVETTEPDSKADEVTDPDSIDTPENPSKPTDPATEEDDTPAEDPTTEDELPTEDPRPSDEEAGRDDPNSDKSNTEEDAPPATEEPSTPIPEELLPPDLLEDGTITGLEILPDPAVPTQVGTRGTASGS